LRFEELERPETLWRLPLVETRGSLFEKDLAVQDFSDVHRLCGSLFLAAFPDEVIL